MIDISKLNKAEVLIALYRAARVQGMGFLQARSEPLTIEQATELLENQTYFDYLFGRVMKVDLSKDTLDPRLYDRNNDLGAAEWALEPLFDGLNTP